jgi:hypothetical protein
MNQYDPWKVGEVTKIINAYYFNEYNGTEVEIIEPLTMRGAIDTSTMMVIHRMSYMIRCKDGMKLNASPDQLEPRVGPKVDVLEEERVA